MLLDQNLKVPVIVIDGWPQYPHKKKVGELVATKLGFHSLDGSLPFRTAAAVAGLFTTMDPSEIALLMGRLLVRYRFGRTYIFSSLCISDLTEHDETVGVYRFMEQLPEVREVLVPIFVAERKAPGLVVWGGRDLRQIYDTEHRFFLDMSPEAFPEGKKHLYVREQRRTVSPIRPLDHAWNIGTDNVAPENVAEIIVGHYHNLAK